MKPLTRSVVLTIVTVALAVLPGEPGWADEKPKPKGEPKKPTVMQRKLSNTQKVLEGLATNDFKKIDAGADGLLECVKEATWKINETDKYLLYSNEFIRGAEKLRKAAKDKNLDAAVLAYVDLTLTCVRCHQHLRDEGLAARPVAPRITAQR